MVVSHVVFSICDWTMIPRQVFRKLPLRKQREFLRADGGEGMKVRTSLDKVYTELNLTFGE